MSNMKETMALLQALPFCFPHTPLTSDACLFSPSSACHIGYMLQQRYTWLGKVKQMTQVLHVVSLYKFSYKQILVKKYNHVVTKQITNQKKKQKREK